MTDWGTTGIFERERWKNFGYGTSNMVGRIKAGKDLTMSISPQDVDEIIKSVDTEEGSVDCTIHLEIDRIFRNG